MHSDNRSDVRRARAKGAAWIGEIGAAIHATAPADAGTLLARQGFALGELSGEPVMPTELEWLRARLGWFPDWGVTLVLLGAGAALAMATHGVVYGVLKRLAQKRGLFLTALVERTSGPSRLALIIVGVSIAATLAPMTVHARALLHHCLLVAFIALAGWAALAALHVSGVVYSRRFKVDVEDNLVARKHLIRILERTAAAFIVVLTIAAALMTVSAVRQYGVTLLASAGAASLIAGLALQPLLTNLIAGVQIAIAQPIRIEDAVIVENEWGWIEEIGATYVVVRLWDWRRMVLPLTYFIQHPFQNWTRENAALIGTSMFYVDYRAPVEAMRNKLTEICQASRLWDRNVVNLAVTDLSEKTMQVRCLMSARNAPETFDLRCEVREKMIAWLREEHPYALPRDRSDIEANWPDRSALSAPSQPVNGAGARPS
jgi:small-conductance mechanosensitive channel